MTTIFRPLFHIARTSSGTEIPFDVCILATGVKPRVELAVDAGIELGKSGAIRVDEHQRTGEPTIFAAGDNCEAMHLVTRQPVNFPLAGPANKARDHAAHIARRIPDRPER